MPSISTGAADRSRRVRAAAALAALAFLAAGCAGGLESSNGATDSRFVEGDGSSTAFAPGDRAAAPDVSGETLDGDPVRLADYEGSVLVINFWASWCGPCRAETPVLEEVYTEHKDDGLEFLGVNIKDNATAARAFEDNQGATYPSLYDQPGEVPQAFRDTVPPAAIPSTLVLDREGRIAARVIGETTYNQLTDLVEPVVAEGGGGGDAAAEPDPA
ncbi:TlpA family protein disulfide reductase [Nocardiopsis trehalosi]|jgi:thiol-disulfide isomerase/thioredoxin|uniref:TlpA family protein disulfide reductase n=1 Tax=Nocardiopsis trehalosi TaxID=109329 RepID=UPI00083015C5|nr:TlpA disulfide reductase family protein [Nocardiopsis trehalosi]